MIKILSQYITLPNFATGLRILLSPVLLYCLLKNYWTLSFFVCFGAGFTDWLDGYLARKSNQTTEFGQYFDPVADKVLMTFSYIGLGLSLLIPGYLCIIIILRDVMILSGAAYVLKHKIVMDLKPSYLSKINTCFQIFLIGYTVFIQFLSSVSIDHSVLDLIHILLIVTTFFTTVGSGIGYGKNFIIALKSKS